MGRTLTLLLAAALLALWITSIAHNQPAVASDEQTIRHPLTTVAGPPGTITPTPTLTPTPPHGHAEGRMSVGPAPIRETPRHRLPHEGVTVEHVVEAVEALLAALAGSWSRR